MTSPAYHPLRCSISAAFLDMEVTDHPHPLGVFPPGYIPPRSELAQGMMDFVANEVGRMRAKRPKDVLFAITFQPGRTPGRTGDIELSDADEVRWLNAFSMAMDRVHLGYGDRFRQLKKRRPWYLLVGQPGAGGIHYHGIASIPPDKVDAFLRAAGPLWKSLTRGGTMQIDELPDAGWLSYITRHLTHMQAAPCHIIPELQQYH